MTATDTIARTDRPSSQPKRRAAGLLVAALTVLTLSAAACSNRGSGPRVASTGSASSRPTDSSNTSGKPSMLTFSRCMRAHGLPDFPDPNSQGVIEFQQSSGSGHSDLNPKAPTYQAAQQACQKYAPGGTSPGDQSKQLAQALKYSKCMRSHGVSAYPDPKVVDGHVEFGGSGGIGRDPHFASANQACQHLMTAGG